MDIRKSAELFQGWVALLLTVGEFSAGIFLYFHEGHVLALYLAVTYLVRETSGGKHYHEIVVDLLHKAKSKV